MWIELIQSLSNDCEFRAPASLDDITTAESAIGVQFPLALRELYQETDGVTGEHGLAMLWPLERTVADNLQFRSDAGFRDLYMPFEHLLFFGDAGNGDQFAFPIQTDEIINRPDVFFWNHEVDSRSWIAPSLRLYFEWLLTGRIEL